MLLTGLDIISNKLPRVLKGRKTGVVCHAPSVTSDFEHITDILHKSSGCHLSAVFGPQHGLSGETQDNMIEWEGYSHPRFNVPVFSLYGKHRKPGRSMLENLDCLLIDLQDVGARPYTYVWTMKACMEACAELTIPVVILDRPNPVSGMAFEGPVLKKNFYTFVGGAEIPLCHRMTIGEIAVWINEEEKTGCDLTVIRMRGYNRKMIFDERLLPWVLPSPNMPSPKTAIVYPGMVLAEALNISEGRGTTIPFELFGAPFMRSTDVLNILKKLSLPGCSFRKHDFIPTFNKFEGEYCSGIQIHVTDYSKFEPVYTAASIFKAISETSDGNFKFNDPPYEYEDTLIPFDILSGDDGLRKALLSGHDLRGERERWKSETDKFTAKFKSLAFYPL
ncbi:MAG TPA: DUF1343 domain-containing protein [Bacteroidales bacterium]|nr:DUF1343 domain-containing protein [Bacteroidales bacterium]